MNTKAFGVTIQEIAASMANSLKPGPGELKNTTAELFKQSQKYQSQVAKDSLTATLKKDDIEDSVIKTITDSMKGKNYEEMIDSVSDDIAKAGTSAEAISKMAKKKASGVISSDNPETVLRHANVFEKYSTYPQAYFNSPNKKINDTRIGAAVGAYVGTTVGARYLSGGNLTTDSYGRKNIVGVPFL